MKKKSLLFAFLLAMLTAVLVACGGDDKPAEKDGDAGESTGSTDAPKFMSLLTGGTSGTYYPLGGGIAKVISDEIGIQTDAVSSNASADNIMSVEAGDAEIAFAQTDVATYAEEGINAFDGNAVKNVVGLGALYPETIQIVTIGKSGITSIEDLKGKKVSVGAPGSGTFINAQQILELHGIDIEKDIDAQYLDFGESAGGIQDGNIDAAFITAGTPTGAVEELKASAEVVILPMDEAKIDELVAKYPYYAKDVIEEGTYGLKEDVTTVAVMAMLVVSRDLPEDVVYDMTKALYENTDKIAHDKAKFIDAKTGLDGVGIEVHPGAQKYFDEVNK